MPYLSKNINHTLHSQVYGRPNVYKADRRQEVANDEAMSEASDIERAPESSEDETDELVAPPPEIEEASPPAHAKKKRKVVVKTEPSPIKLNSDTDTEAFEQLASGGQSRKKATKSYSKRSTGFNVPRKIATKYDKRFTEEKKNEAPGFVPVPRLKGIAGNELRTPGTLDEAVSSKPPGRKSGRRTKKEESPEPSKPPERTFIIPATSMLKKKLGLSDQNAPDTSARGESTRSRRPRSGKESDSELSSLTESEPDDVSTSYDALGEPSVDRIEVSKRCPVCDKKFLQSTWSLFLITLPKDKRDGRLITRHQVQFHNFHQKHSAKTEWRKRKYPTIDWTRLPDRVNALRENIESVIDGTEPSIYADGLRDLHRGKSGQRQKVANEFAGDFGSNSVGYYGGRGAQTIGVEVAEMFTSKFLEDAQHDIISAAGGIPMYIQKVIVPEVASRLIAQDMECDLAEARDILGQSADLGQALCEEENDEVHEDEDEDMSQSD